MLLAQTKINECGKTRKGTSSTFISNLHSLWFGKIADIFFFKTAFMYDY